ncbi:asparagine synthase (glutamine-hydrolyzing) [Sedimenticola hydrogenitrophicus]|uniref:asparagine synthase (glutamine-hydrolyzing) n=1 Tax=Sedimenticola hydrogenitrophicus TaxID=2967975 RepID=UPI0021A372C9|nr:asparagine synthase (glutamine-hydrolyzing) [Sedimenticola hydrogenitrophicus]
MCGIFAIIKNAPDREASLRQVVETGLERIRHRGPDGSDVWIDADRSVGFGHVRLAIVDLETGAQPMSLEDEITIIFNGEIYNYIELRRELGVESFRTSSDTEVILRAYREWGEDCVQRLRGMFAFLIWDPRKQAVFFARDRFGIKPLYWHKSTDGSVYFSSEIKGLLPFLSRREVDAHALSDYFSFQFCLGEKTLLDGVRQVLPAHCGWVGPDTNVKISRYWEVHYNLDFDHTDKYFIERIQALADESASLHMRADVEVGAYVSGGVDSSLLAILGSGHRTTANFRIFNGKFLEGDAFDESRYAQSVADDHGMELYVASITEQDFVDTISKVIYHLDSPIAGPGAFPQYMVSKLASQHLKVVLGGQGGDEIFGGYARYLIAYFEQCIAGAIDGSLHNGHFVVTYESIIPNLTTLRAYKPLMKEFWSAGLFEAKDQRYFRLINRANTIEPMLRPGVIKREQAFEEFRQIFWGENVGHESYFDLMTHFDFKTLLPALLQVEDRMSMAHGLESRVPFLDHPLVELAATAPANVKFLNGELKRWVREAFADKLPKAIRNRQDKMGFPVPLNMWLKRGGAARDLIGDIFSSQKARTRPYLRDGVSLDTILDSQSIYGRNLWALLSLELWHQQFVD